MMFLIDPMIFRKIFSQFLLLSALIFSASCTKASKSGLASPLPSKWIAHALGEYKGKTYLNCLECFEDNYGKGYRIFEMDFMMTNDGRLAGIHDGLEQSVGLTPTNFSYEEFSNLRNPDYQFVNEEKIATLLQEKSDWWLITDVKTNNVNGLRRLCDVLRSRALDCASRVIPQIYSPDEYQEVAALGFKQIIFTLYRYGNEKAKVKEFLKTADKVVALTFHFSWWDEEWRSIGKESGRQIYVHTVNDPSVARDLLGKGVNAIYTDNLFF